MDLTRLVPDWDREDRWRLRDELRSLGIRSSASVPIRTGEDQPIYGMLWVHSTEQRIFTDDDLAFVGTVAAVISQSVRRARIDQTFETVVETSPDVIVKFDRELRHTYGNVSMERVLGIRATELVGKTSREAGMPEPQVGNWELVLAQALRTGREQTTELGVRTRLGDRQFQARIVPEFGANGAPESLLAILRDVTDQRRAESERAELYRDVLAQRTRLSELMENLQAQHAGERDRAERAMLVGHLTPREREVLRLLVRGWTNREIAAELNVSRGTVKNHVARILTTLDASDRTQAAVRAVELGITVSD
jgi:PAS domain S-box-containing protein